MSNDQMIQANQVVTQPYEPAKPKKTNYRRLWRESKKREVALHNFAQGVIQGVPRVFKDKKEVDAFMKFVDYLRSQTVNKID